MEETQVRCPQCGSTQIAPVRKDYDMGCGCLGLILFGWIGLLLGLLGGGNVEMVCANCGARWEPGRHNRSSSGCLASVFLVIVIVILLAGAFALFGAEPVNSTFRDNRQCHPLPQCARGNRRLRNHKRRAHHIPRSPRGFRRFLHNCGKPYDLP